MTTQRADLIRQVREVNQELVLGRAIYEPTIAAMSPGSAGTEGHNVGDLAVSPAIALGPMFTAVTEELARVRNLGLCNPFGPLHATMSLKRLDALLINVPTKTHCRVADVLHWTGDKEHAVLRVYTNVRQHLGIVAEATMHFSFQGVDFGGEQPWRWTPIDAAPKESTSKLRTVIDQAAVATWVKLIFIPLPEMIEVALTRVPLALLFGRVLEACVLMLCNGNPEAFRSLEMNMMRPVEQGHELELHIRQTSPTTAIVTVIDPDFKTGGRKIVAAATLAYNNDNSD
jgi:hypothetical protein